VSITESPIACVRAAQCEREGQRSAGRVTLLSQQQDVGSRPGYDGFPRRQLSEPPQPEAPQVRRPAATRAPRRRHGVPADLVRFL
jgi:hypothetical protein